MNRRVVVTGIGSLSPIGNDCDTLYKNLKLGSNGINHITQFDTSNFEVKIAGEVIIDLEKHISKKELNRMDRFSAFSLIAAEEAINQSKIIEYDDFDSNRAGVIVGSGIGGISTFESQHKRLLENPKRVSPFFIPSMISDIACGHISIRYNFKGPNFAAISACSSASHSIGTAYEMIKNDKAEVMVTGGSEATITPMAVAGFSNMRALTKNPNPNQACRPFDKERDGFVMSEGSGILIIEELEFAKKRGANIIAEISGYGSSADAFHLTSPDPTGKGAYNSMQNSIKDANLSPSDIDYINAHGTSTPFNDKIETIAIKNLFKDKLPSLSSTKSMTGHLLGAAGAIEAIISILSINNNFIPPTINYVNPDPECNLNYTPNEVKFKNVKHALSNTFGFGGHNATLIFSKYT